MRALEVRRAEGLRVREFGVVTTVPGISPPCQPPMSLQFPPPTGASFAGATGLPKPYASHPPPPFPKPPSQVGWQLACSCRSTLFNYI